MVNKMQSAYKTYTVLLLSAPIGFGHRLAAEALEQVLSQNPHIKVVNANVFHFFPQFLGNLFLSMYLMILKYCPCIYELVYKWSNKQGGSLWLRALLNGVLAFLGRSYLNKIKPDAVIATHATPAGIISHYKKKEPSLWLGAVITDYTIHRWWECEGIDTYFLADALLCPKIVQPTEVVASGIPIRKQFIGLNKSVCRSSFGWKIGDKICLLMGGGEGLLPMEGIIETLQLLSIENLRIIVITGNNEKMAKKLRNKFTSGVEIYGFREDIPQLMTAADVLITKAGGLTSAEALVAGVKLLIYKPLPGQESGNASFLQKYCGAYVILDMQEMAETLTRIFQTPNILPVINNHAHPRAAEEICTYVLKKLK